MNDLTVDAVSGKISSGKTTLARAICEADHRFRRVPLAYPLKKDIADLCGVTVDFIEEHKAMFRPILQYYGTDIMRELYGPDYWVSRLVEYARVHRLTHIVVDDVRFPNELEGLRDAAERGFMSVRLDIGYAEQAHRYQTLYGGDLTREMLTHPSETSLDDCLDFDQTIFTNITPKEVMAELVLHALERRGLAERGETSVTAA
jgi:hypothetical protein